MKRKLLISFGVVASLMTITALALPTILHTAGLHPEFQGEMAGPLPGRRALIITTSHDVLSAPGETTGDQTGVMASELTHPYYSFLQSGLEIDVASIKGGLIPVDPQTLNFVVRTPEDERYMDDAVLQAKVANSIAVADVDFTVYDIVFLSGGWGAAYDLGQSTVLGKKISEAYYSEKKPLIGGVCHGVLGLINAADSEGNLLIAGRKMTGVTDKQIKELGIEVTPLHPETELRKAGARFEANSAFRDVLATHTVVDEEKRFVTGQNQNSGRETAQAMLALLSER
ncbi:MAG: type 1 glutamine amidotransferase domain-containing protein [Gammaproteobacteria bacterium]|nr:type 1 glutamine amidotransferase domain-containing protein [Gammaproteobacteria bacterium]|tara:strand:- start:336 stop:1190 length:855 start_codon:yes stop_codon:yes gene_type:complete